MINFHHHHLRNRVQEHNYRKNNVPCPFLFQRGYCLKGSNCDFSHSKLHCINKKQVSPKTASRIARKSKLHGNPIKQFSHLPNISPSNREGPIPFALQSESLFSPLATSNGSSHVPSVSASIPIPSLMPTIWILDTELLPWGYEIFRCDHLVPSDGSSRGGGTLLACRSCLRCSPVCLSQNNNGLELSAIELNANNSGKVLVAVIYRPPKANTTWIRNFTDLFSQSTYNKIVVLGDFNLPTITWLEGSGLCDSDDSAIFNFCQCLSENNLFQLIDSPTRKDNCLDLLLTNIVDCVTNIAVTSSDEVGVPSDHDVILHLI